MRLCNTDNARKIFKYLFERNAAIQKYGQFSQVSLRPGLSGIPFQILWRKSQRHEWIDQVALPERQRPCQIYVSDQARPRARVEYRDPNDAGVTPTLGQALVIANLETRGADPKLPASRPSDVAIGLVRSEST